MRCLQTRPFIAGLGATRGRVGLFLATLFLCACGGGGGSSTPPPVNQPPSANAGPDQAVVENTQVTLNASASSDADGTVASYVWTQTAGPAVTLAGATQAQPTFTAPGVGATTVLTFQVTVTDDDGASNSDTVTVTVNNLNQSPVAAAGPDQMVNEGVAVTLNGAASDDPDGTIASFAWTQTAGPIAALTGADTAMPTFTAPLVTGNMTLTFQLTVSDNFGATGSDTVDIAVTDTTVNVTISGKVTYEHVKHNPVTNGLDFNLATADAVRGATVQALNGAGNVLASTRSDDNGDYALSVPPTTPVRLRVRAEVIQVGPPSWDVRLADNTNSGAAYVLDGSLLDSGMADSSRNLHAPSGWNSVSNTYTSTRAAAPFAILESVYEAIVKTAAVDPTVVFPPVLVNWSVNNVPSECPGGNAQGCIVTSNYDATAIYVLGAAGNDTDEFDGHIIVHEWGHYFEEKLSRSDSTGGPHTGGDVLDTRIAFGEGFGNGLSGIITGDPVYRDSSGPNESFGFEIDNEFNDTEGWFSESTVQALLYDLFDASSDRAEDTMALGWGTLYNTFVSDAYRNNAARTTIFSYLARLRADNPASAADIATLAAAANVNGSDAFGAGETFLPPGTTNSGDILPLYADIAATASPLRVCSINEFGTFNRLSNRRFLKLQITTAATYRIQVAGVGGIDADVVLYKNAALLNVQEEIGDDEIQRALTPGDHVLEVYDFCNIFPGEGGCPGNGNSRSCIDVTVTQL